MLISIQATKHNKFKCMKTYFITLTLLASVLISCSKEEGEGGRSSISGKVEGTEVFSARTEVTEITAVPGHEIDSKDFMLLNTPGSSDNYFIWFNDLANIQGAPLITNRIGVKVDYNSGSSSNISIATSVTNAINNISGSPFSATRNQDIITVTCNSSGYVVDADNGSSKLGVDVKNQGRDESIVQSGPMADEDVFIIYGDADEIHDDNTETSFDGTFKFSNLRQGTYKIYVYSKDESLPEPLIPVMASIEIGKNDDGDIGTITIEKRND